MGCGVGDPPNAKTIKKKKKKKKSSNTLDLKCANIKIKSVVVSQPLCAHHFPLQYQHRKGTPLADDHVNLRNILGFGKMLENLAT
jgi:hypothetical protein